VLISPGVRVHLAVEPIDFRNSIDGLEAAVRARLEDNPLSGQVFVFHNRTRTALKLLFWDHGGFVLVYKRLERGRFRLPATSGVKVPLSHAELAALLEGIDLSRAKRLIRWNPANSS
jgi:transposase